jgi:murein DD-endopeptidase MepM/ murein hydrolase activator NlpD
VGTAVRPERESLAKRLERERLEQERAYRERRARVERARAERERAERERVDRRRREHAEWLRREREFLRGQGRLPARPKPAVAARPEPAKAAPRVRAAPRRRGLFWPTAKAAFAVTAVVALGAGLGSLLGLPIPGLDAKSSQGTLLNSASTFGVDAGTPPGLSSGYVFPVMGPHDFGGKDARIGASRYGHIHQGQDIFAKTGTPEVAVHDGVVVDGEPENGRYSGGRGNYLVIYSPPDDRSFVYMHLLKPPQLHIGDQVHAGQVIGQLGCTGSCDGPHLHFEVRIGKASLRAKTKPIDPLPYLQQWPEPLPR